MAGGGEPVREGDTGLDTKLLRKGHSEGNSLNVLITYSLLGSERDLMKRV